MSNYHMWQQFIPNVGHRIPEKQTNSCKSVGDFEGFKVGDRVGASVGINVGVDGLSVGSYVG